VDIEKITKSAKVKGYSEMDLTLIAEKDGYGVNETEIKIRTTEELRIVIMKKLVHNLEYTA
jgi:hypothetical protein